MRARHERPQHSSAREICVCVDDFGLHNGINEAVLALIGMGRVQAVSAQVGGAFWGEGARCEASIGCCGCSPGVILRDWESPNPLSNKARSPDEHP